MQFGWNVRTTLKVNQYHVIVKIQRPKSNDRKTTLKTTDKNNLYNQTSKEKNTLLKYTTTIVPLCLDIT